MGYRKSQALTAHSHRRRPLKEARSMGLDVLARARMRVITGDTPQHAPLPQTLTA